MTAKIFQLEDHRLRRRPTGADTRAHNPSWALDQALRAIDANPAESFAAKAATFQRAFREAVDGKVTSISPPKRKGASRARKATAKRGTPKK